MKLNEGNHLLLALPDDNLELYKKMNELRMPPSFREGHGLSGFNLTRNFDSKVLAHFDGSVHWFDPELQPGDLMLFPVRMLHKAPEEVSNYRVAVGLRYLPRGIRVGPAEVQEMIRTYRLFKSKHMMRNLRFIWQARRGGDDDYARFMSEGRFKQTSRLGRLWMSTFLIYGAPAPVNLFVRLMAAVFD